MGVGIGGVLEPLQANPTIIEDNCFIGARSEVVEGVIIGENSVLSMGVYIGQSTPIYDRETGEVTYGRVPPGSVVISGTLPKANGAYSLYAAIIVKKVDAQTRSKTSINELLRPQVKPPHEGLVMILDKLFQLMAEKQASDIFISAGAPIHIKIQGNTIPVNQQVMLPDMIEKIAYELMSPDQIKAFEATMEMNLSFGVPNVGNFRVNIFRQRGSTSIVIRFILGNIPAMGDLGLPTILGELIMEKRGLILIVGATGSGKKNTKREEKNKTERKS
eukprot:TRINITY_DN7445_c0_g1_i1.p2 TRINITY_DN7445_c0_g1~~TRINITY_DN7445_c0_g1_i1.p2  ORF type:complete len:275 (-),score=49.38 TRINITY_DN7445_c0_g1_i1:68-892(-)